MRSLFVVPFTLMFFSIGCGSSDAGSTGGDGGATGTGGGASSSAGATASGDHAQLRFVYEADWKDHLGACVSISDYRIKFGAIPVPVTAPIDVTSSDPTDYVEVDGRTYADADVLHLFTCSKSQTSKQTLQLFSKFGIDLALSGGHEYTVTLAGSAATLAEDP